jgi:hypothetical protein
MQHNDAGGSKGPVLLAAGVLLLCEACPARCLFGVSRCYRTAGWASVPSNRVKPGSAQRRLRLGEEGVFGVLTVMLDPGGRGTNRVGRRIRRAGDSTMAVCWLAS